MYVICIRFHWSDNKNGKQQLPNICVKANAKTFMQRELSL